ncbi:family 2A encapsulin nanocompartment cargo protein cysteine desulfurase [Pseudonocardia ailaonensis]|uniref:cysteine desulfurase n=1 Tax=Pseudonocardia ailaonensis TaxID=367279 RepID=A0ABN2MU21_9PSEU
MTTPRSTADGLPAGRADGLPAWLPDEDTLSRLAGEMFRALPGADLPAASAPPETPAAAPGVDSGRLSSVGGPVPGDDVPGFGAPFAAGPPSVPGAGSPGPGAGTPGLPAPEPPGVTAGTSPPAGPPPTNAAASWASFGATTPISPETPAVPVIPTAPAVPLDAGQFYFLTGSPTSTGVPVAPAFGELAVPPLPPTAEPVRTSGPYYFASTPEPSAAAFDVRGVRRDFPILSERVNGTPLIWLDNAATTQKPRAVIDRLVHFYEHENSNIHRAAHELAARATDAYEGARRTVADFLGARSPEEIVFTRGTTEAINLVANTWGAKNIGAGDEIVISHLEHHANIVPWQMLRERTGAVIKVIPVDDRGVLLLDEAARLIGERTKLVSVTQVSNALGTVVPVEQLVAMGHAAGARVLVDAAQSVPHMPIDVTALDADFLVFSGHKIFGPTGIGALYGKREVLEDMPPWEGGGNMIVDVTLERSTFHGPPGRFEAGTGNIADAAGLGAALEYVSRIGLPAIAAYEHMLVEYATAGLREVPGLRLVGTAPEKASVVSFVLDGYDPPQVGSALNEDGIAVRAGHHCAQPILRRLGLEATVRPSFAFYNTCDEVDALVAAVHRLAARR